MLHVCGRVHISSLGEDLLLRSCFTPRVVLHEEAVCASPQASRACPLQHLGIVDTPNNSAAFITLVQMFSHTDISTFNVLHRHRSVLCVCGFWRTCNCYYYYRLNRDRDPLTGRLLPVTQPPVALRRLFIDFGSLCCDRPSRCENGSWFDHVLEWYEASKADPEHIIFLRYEDILADPATYIKTVADFVGIETTPEIIDKV